MNAMEAASSLDVMGSAQQSGLELASLIVTVEKLIRQTGSTQS